MEDELASSSKKSSTILPLKTLEAEAGSQVQEVPKCTQATSYQHSVGRST